MTEWNINIISYLTLPIYLAIYSLILQDCFKKTLKCSDLYFASILIVHLFPIERSMPLWITRWIEVQLLFPLHYSLTVPTTSYIFSKLVLQLNSIIPLDRQHLGGKNLFFPSLFLYSYMMLCVWMKPALSSLHFFNLYSLHPLTFGKRISSSLNTYIYPSYLCNRSKKC